MRTTYDGNWPQGHKYGDVDRLAWHHKYGDVEQSSTALVLSTDRVWMEVKKISRNRIFHA